MTAKQREELQYISGWILGLSYGAEKIIGEGLVDVAECITMLLNEDRDQEESRMVVEEE